MTKFRFEYGDYIQVTTSAGSTFKGTALTSLAPIGSAIFQVLLPSSQILTFNCNFDKPELLFSAVVARGDGVIR